jgi:hypothetical protein
MHSSSSMLTSPEMTGRIEATGGNRRAHRLSTIIQVTWNQADTITPWRPRRSYFGGTGELFAVYIAATTM